MKNLNSFLKIAIIVIIALFIWDLTIDRNFTLFSFGDSEDLTVKDHENLSIIGGIFSALLGFFFFKTRDQYKTASHFGLAACLVGFIGFALFYFNYADLYNFEDLDFSNELSMQRKSDSLDANLELGRALSMLLVGPLMIAAIISLVKYAKTDKMKNFLKGMAIIYILPFVGACLIDYFAPKKSDYMEKEYSSYAYTEYTTDYDKYEDDRNDYYEDTWGTISEILHFLPYVAWAIFFNMFAEHMNFSQIGAPQEPSPGRKEEETVIVDDEKE